MSVLLMMRVQYVSYYYIKIVFIVNVIFPNNIFIKIVLLLDCDLGPDDIGSSADISVVQPISIEYNDVISGKN